MTNRIALLVVCSLFPFLLVGCSSSSSPGARIVNTKSDPLLPDGSQWTFDVVLPSDSLPDDKFLVQVRRKKTDSPGTEKPISAFEAEENKTIAGFRIESIRKARVSLQLLDLRDYSPDSSIENPVKLVGGLNFGGQLAKFQNTPFEIIGNPGGHAIQSSADWDGDELLLLKFNTGSEDTGYVYNVFVVMAPDFE